MKYSTWVGVVHSSNTKQEAVWGCVVYGVRSTCTYTLR